VRATKKDPKVTIQKNDSLYISVDDTLHPTGMTLTTCEFFAFNTGDFVSVKTNKCGRLVVIINTFHNTFKVVPADFQIVIQKHALPSSFKHQPK